MNADHLDSLARAGFNRAVIKCIQDSLGARGATELRGFLGRAPGLGIEVVPEWSLQAVARLAALPTTRRYVWGVTVESNVGCPADSLFWRSVLRDRGAEILNAFPEVRHIAVDLEIYTGSRHHYDAGPCRCPGCLAEFAARASGAPGDLETFEEGRLAAILQGLLGELMAMRPGLEMDFFDLDYNSFVHRAMVRALVRTGLATTNYCERSYARAAAAIPEARAPLDSLNLHAPLVCGLQLKNFAPQQLVGAVGDVLQAAEGFFIFTSYSLWQAPENLAGPYLLAGSQAATWDALRIANGAQAGITTDLRPGADPPHHLRLGIPEPNPFRGSARFRFELGTAADVVLRVLDSAGREVRRFDLPAQSAGQHSIRWDGRDGSGSTAASGIYFVQLEGLGEKQAARITRLR
jgi:hypothetical protein